MGCRSGQGGFVPIETLLVTGSTGFVGSHVLEAARDGAFRLRALVRKESDAARLTGLGVDVVLGSLEDAAALREAVSGADSVLHLAAATKARSVQEYERSNVAGTRAMIGAVLAASPRPRRLVYLSSLAAVGPSLDGTPVTSETPPRPLTAYGRTKLAGEEACSAVDEDIEVAILRAPAVYGPRDRDVFEFFRMAKAGVIVLPAGARRLQMIHAADLARALVLCATAQGTSGVYHVAEARSYAMEEMARMVGTAIGRNVRVVHVPGAVIKAAASTSETVAGLFGKSTIFNRDKAREILAPAWLCETDRARQDFGFEAHIPLQVGLDETAKWYFENQWL